MRSKGKKFLERSSLRKIFDRALYSLRGAVSVILFCLGKGLFSWQWVGGKCGGIVAQNPTQARLCVPTQKSRALVIPTLSRFGVHPIRFLSLGKG
jgi:hypothetical protein